MKKKLNFNDFKSNEIFGKESLSIKGGHTRIRRPGSTTTTAIWDDVNIRKENKGDNIDLIIRISRRGD